MKDENTNDLFMHGMYRARAWWINGPHQRDAEWITGTDEEVLAWVEGLLLWDRGRQEWMGIEIRRAIGEPTR